MEKIKIFINANIEDVKEYLGKLMNFMEINYLQGNNKINKDNSLEVIKSNNKNKVTFWSKIYEQLYMFYQLNYKTLLNQNISYIKVIIFLLFGNKNIIHDFCYQINLELYENSLYSKEIINFRNCILILIIQIFIYSSENNIKKDLSNNINKIIKCPYIKKSLHVIKSLINKDIIKEQEIFILSLFYFIYKKYQKYFIEFLISEKCDIKKEYKKILIDEYYYFQYDENSIINYSTIIFEIKLSYSLLGLNPNDEKISRFLLSIKENKIKNELYEVITNNYKLSMKNTTSSINDKDNNINNLDEEEKGSKFEKQEKKTNYKMELSLVLEEIKQIKTDIKNIKTDITELKNVQLDFINNIYSFLDKIKK